MKQDIRSNVLVKAVALLLSVACGTAAILGWSYTLVHYDSIFQPKDYTHSYAYNQAMNDSFSALSTLMHYYDRERRGEQLTYLEGQQYAAVKGSLDVSATNFRYTVRDNKTGELLLSSAGEDSLNNVDAIHSTLRSLYPTGRDYAYMEFDEDRTLSVFYDDEGAILYQIEGQADGPYTPEEVNKYALEYGCDLSFAVRDGFYTARYGSYSQTDQVIFYLSIGLTAAWLLLVILLMSCAGRRKGAETFTLNWTDRVPYDLYLFAVGWAATLCFALGMNLIAEGYRFHYGEPAFSVMIWTSAAPMAAGFALVEAGLMSTATRCKTHTLLRNTLTWKLCKLIGRFFRGLGRWWGTTFGSWSMTQQVIVGFLLYLVGTALTSATLVLIPVYQGAVLFALCKWSEEWRKIRQGTQAIVGGAPETVIDTTGMDRFICKDLKEHAQQLNDLGSAINSAVEERMKSERMKTELITNVSHDLKTPLTSIINYVDLLKKEDIQEEKAREYIEVLDRKSQRLKKLTEDLVEASKASTGAIAVNPERLGMVQLVNQALGEYSEKFAAAGLVPVPTLPQEEVYVNADGRHMWRIVDNLLGNCLKYALSGTRIYLDLVCWGGSVVLSVKNVSAQQLNIPAEQLLERFVRGDENRATEGSGLGLSIARSLTELQGGTFRLEVDGDLFKAVVSLPVVK